jgi:hypothetical protein
MALFVSYSSQDRSAIDALTTALRRARQQVWFDEELAGGEAWWGEILRQIRSCEVFIVALSNHSLRSKPCQAELRYAQALQRPILPVQIGPVDSMRANPLAALQIIDYQNPTVDSGIQLVTAVHSLASQAPPLPSPLPDEPPVPFAYLMRLSSTLAEQELSPQQQTYLLAELKSGLDEDGDDPAARRDIAQLLGVLRNRHDVTWRTRTEIDNLLASIESKSPAPAMPAQQSPQPDTATRPAPPVQTRSTPQHVAQAYPTRPAGGESTGSPPPSAGARQGAGGDSAARSRTGSSSQPSHANGADENRRSRKRWMIAGAAGLATVVAVVVVALVVAQRPGSPPSSAPNTAPPGGLGSVLLTAPDVSAIMGVPGMEPADRTQAMRTFPATLSNPACLGALNPIEDSVYQNSGYTGVSGLGLHTTGVGPPHRVYQAAVGFPSAQRAQAFVSTSAASWKACAGQTVTLTEGNQTVQWAFGDVAGANPRITQPHNQVAPGGLTCQHAMSAVSNIVVDVQACGPVITNEASRIANQMGARVTQ